jgi:hypothetical protein
VICMRKTVISSVIAIGLGTTAAAQAFVNGTGTCPLGPSDGYWEPGTKKMRILTAERFGALRPFPAINAPSLPEGEKDYAAVQAATDWGMRGWVVSSGFFNTGGSVSIVPDRNGYYGGGVPEWFDNGNELSEIWWESNPPCDNAYACTAWDHATCVGWGNNRILAADIVVSGSSHWDIIEQNSMAKCFLRTSGSMESTVMHEIGHAYGLEHESARVSVMDPNKPRVRNCSFWNGYHDAVMPDDLQGYLQHHKSYSGTRRNLSGTPWWKANGLGHLTAEPIVFSTLASPAQTVTLTYTLHSYYRHATGNYAVSYRLREDIFGAGFNPSDGRYTFDASLPYVTTVSSLSNEYSARQSINMQIIPSDLPRAGVWYHVWVQVDSGYVVAETDESDNAFPTGVIIRRLN